MLLLDLIQEPVEGGAYDLGSIRVLALGYEAVYLSHHLFRQANGQLLCHAISIPIRKSPAPRSVELSGTATAFFVASCACLRRCQKALRSTEILWWIPHGSLAIVGVATIRTEGASVNEALLEAFRHNGWATRQLLAFCRGLSEEQLTSPSAGGYGSILATFSHIVLADAGYLGRLGGRAPAWLGSSEGADVDQLEDWVEETEQLWEQLLSEPVDAERLIVVDNGANEVRAGVFVAQALHHGNSHREQICATLTSLRMQPPDVQAWGYAWATGRLRERNATG